MAFAPKWHCDCAAKASRFRRKRDALAAASRSVPINGSFAFFCLRCPTLTPINIKTNSRWVLAPVKASTLLVEDGRD